MAKKVNLTEDKMHQGIVFDPQKNYSWQKETEFKLSGTEFSLMFNNLNKFLTSDAISPKGIMALLDVGLILQAKLKDAVEQGQAVEVKE